MRLLIVTIIILIQCGFLFAQDGSNIKYVEPKKLNKSFIGRRVHLDFGRKYISSMDLIRPELWDTVFIEVNDTKVKFIEHRVDDTLNNSFNQQYLESIDEIEGLKLRITQFVILKINKKDISVKAYFAFFDKNKKIVPDKSFTKDLSFEKKDIIEYLFYWDRKSDK